MRIRIRRTAILILLTLSACAKDSVAPVSPGEPSPKPPPTPLGVYEIAITGIGGEAQSNVTAVNPARPDGLAASLTNAGSSLTIEQISSISFTEGTRSGGGQRYVSFTYRVRNGTGAALNNLTMLMVSRSNTIAGTPLSSLGKRDGTAASPTLAPLVVPTGAVGLGSDAVTMEGLYPDVLQVFEESEVAAITLPGDVTGVFPYGFMVRNADPGANHRQLPAATGANQFDGLLTISFRVPLQPTSIQDLYSFVFQLMAVEDSETRLTESIEEGQDSAAVRRLRERATALGATQVTVLAGSAATSTEVTDYPGQRQICQVRTAGTGSSPVTYITTPGAYTRIEMLRQGESGNACGAYFRSGTPTVPTPGAAYPITVKAMDRYGNVLTAAADTVTLSRVSGPAATFGAAAPLASGAATINVTYADTGTSVLAATGRRLRGRRSLPVAATTTVAVNAGGNQAAMAGTAVPTAPSVIVRDLSGTPKAGVSVTFAVASGGGSITSATATTDASGIATAGGWTLGSTALLNTATATAVGAAAPATFRGSGCSGGGGTGFAITLCYLTETTAAQRAAFDSAATRWNGVITGDIPDFTSTWAEGSCGTGSPAFNFTTDDVVILAEVTPIDGTNSLLGSGGWCWGRSGSYLPIVGRIRIDSTDMAALESTGMLGGLVVHEMGHVLGIGSSWVKLGLLQNPSPVGGPAVDTYYSGSGGIAGFNLIGGTSYTGNKAPVENTYGTGTINLHWRESVLGTEVMTGLIYVGPLPLSQLTVRSLGDLGYAVDTTSADPFTLSSSLRAEPGRSLPLGNDVLDLPRYLIDTRTLRVQRIR